MSLKDTQFTFLPVQNLSPTNYALFQSISPRKDLQNVFEHCFFVIVTPLMKIVVLNNSSIARKQQFGQRRKASTELMNRILWSMLSPLQMVIYDWSKMHLFYRTDMIYTAEMTSYAALSHIGACAPRRAQGRPGIMATYVEIVKSEFPEIDSEVFDYITGECGHGPDFCAESSSCPLKHYIPESNQSVSVVSVRL